MKTNLELQAMAFNTAASMLEDYFNEGITAEDINLTEEEFEEFESCCKVASRVIRRVGKVGTALNKPNP